MKILFITDNFPPEVNAPATRTFEHCQEWIKDGAEVTVLTCAPNFPHGRVYDGYRNRLYQTEQMDGIRVIRLWSFIAANKGFAMRIADYVSFALTSFLAGLWQAADIVIATSPQFFTTFAAFGLSRIKRKPWIFELRDLWPESIKTVGAMKAGTVLQILEKIELFLYRNSTAVVAVTDAFKRNLISRGIAGDKIEVITNGSNLNLFSPRPKDPKIMAALGLQNKFVIGYIGTHGMAHGLESIVDAIAKMDGDGEFAFLFIGDGARKQDVVDRAGRLGLANTKFLDPVAKELVPSYLSVLDAMLVPLIKSDTFKTVIPSKIFEAAAMGKPILLGVEGQAKEIVEGNQAGLCFEPENQDDFIRTAMLLKGDRALYGRLQEGCARLARNFDRRGLARHMLSYMNNIVESREARI